MFIRLFFIQTTRVLLGQSFDSKDRRQAEWIAQFPRFTYRKNFTPLSNRAKTDYHWGCCIRTGQGLLAQYILRYSQSHNPAFRNRFSDSDPLSLFWDVPEAHFGIHAFCREISELGGKPGTYSQPSMIAAAIARLLAPFSNPVHIVSNGLISLNDIGGYFRDDAPLLLLVPVMLGVRKLDRTYDNFVKASLNRPQSIGIVGGTRKKSFLFVGYTGGELLYFDPHCVMNAVQSENEHRRLYRPKLKSIALSKVESSMLVAYCVRGQQDLEEIVRAVGEGGQCPIALENGASAEMASGSACAILDDWDVIDG
jgi:cysteine protease ATG4